VFWDLRKKYPYAQIDWVVEEAYVELLRPLTMCGEVKGLSQIIPFKIYNQTAYSVVTESCIQNHFSFFTEKIVKPIMARRLFVMFSGKGYLVNLRKLGFQTFDNIIDESYDSIDNNAERWQHAWNQVDWLNQQPQELVLEKIRPIVEHNFSVMMNTDWYGIFRKQLTQNLVNVLVADVDSTD
jgi:hypothetical protein